MYPNCMGRFGIQCIHFSFVVFSGANSHELGGEGYYYKSKGGGTFAVFQFSQWKQRKKDKLKAEIKVFF